MNITHIITTINRGGAENQLIQNLLTQKKNGINVSVVFLKGNGYWRKLLLEKGIKVYGPYFNRYYYFNFIGIFNIFKLLNNVDSVIHCHMPPSLLITYLCLLFNNRKNIIYTSHNDEPFIPWMIIDNILSRHILSKARIIIAITSSVKDYLISKYKLRSSHIEIINYSFDSSIYKSNKLSKKEFEFYDPKKQYIGTVARLEPQKRLDLLLKAFKNLISKNNKFRLVIIGTGKERNNLLEISRKLDISKYIVWISYSEYVLDHMRHWNVFSLTSAYEGFGLVLLEAIYVKLPIVAMDVSSIKEIVGPCGEIVEFENHYEFAEKVYEVTTLKKSYFSKNHIRNFSVENNFKRHLNIYKFFTQNN